ncbi:ribosome maturation factor RimM [Anthocerotibacter panamensis]|uniref:ribosome maturation factor RimM n=1 Tax=Anthocerotibacter panamensis TaxID=2857077 RepID=UPI001C40331F|nr:ribosome maturation factor RimM [Anthocerotibacter panamensis]
MSELSPIWLLVGSVVGAHGILGEVKVYPETDFPQRLTDKGGLRRLVTVQGVEKMVRIQSGRLHKGLYLLRLEGIVERTTAEALKGAQIFVSSTERPDLAPGEFLVGDLVGLQVRRTDTGAQVGMVKDVMSTGAQDLLVVATAAGEILIPFVEALVPEVHADWLGVVPIVGLLDPTEAGEADGDA